MFLQCKSTRTAASNRQTWCAILEFFSTNTLSMTNHISTVTKSCFFHLRRIRQIKRCLNEKCLRTLVQALVISRLDYCNSILINLPDTTLHPYTTILHTAARLAKPHCCTTRQKGEAKGSHHPSSSAFHWLPIEARISFKICVLMFNIHSGSCPRYMSSLVTPCTTVESRSSLRSSAKDDYVTQRTSSSFGRRAFAVAGPSEWNNLPVSIRHASSIGSFKSKLKTHLFQIYYSDNNIVVTVH